MNIQTKWYFKCKYWAKLELYLRYDMLLKQFLTNLIYSQSYDYQLNGFATLLRILNTSFQKALIMLMKINMDDWFNKYSIEIIFQDWSGYAWFQTIMEVAKEAKKENNYWHISIIWYKNNF
jgi:hypothetical protein